MYPEQYCFASKSTSLCINAYFANRPRRASESTKPYFGASMGTVEAFV